MLSNEIRDKFLKFFESRGHTIIPSVSVVPENDPSVLFTTAGMQQFKPYFLGVESPHGSRVASSQKCVRTSDIEEVGDESHLTFFEMLGNFSFGGTSPRQSELRPREGGYWKKEAIEYAHELITKDFGLKIDYVSIFSGEPSTSLDSELDSRSSGQEVVPEDIESAEIWKSIDPSITIKKFGRADNFWGPTGEEGPCGPTTEIYVDGIEIWNIVFNEYYQEPLRSDLKGSKGPTLRVLETKGIDTGMGLERLVKVIQKTDSVFETDLFKPIMQAANSKIVADHIRTSVFMIADGVTPSNTDRGYILRRLLRRAYVKNKNIDPVIDAVINHPSYKGLYNFALNTKEILREELDKFEKTLSAGLKQIEKGEDPFILFTSYGLPLEIIEEVAVVDKEKFARQMAEHKQLSSAAGEQKFKNKL